MAGEPSTNKLLCNITLGSANPIADPCYYYDVMTVDTE